LTRPLMAVFPPWHEWTQYGSDQAVLRKRPGARGMNGHDSGRLMALADRERDGDGILWVSGSAYSSGPSPVSTS
jgi:hypothetical protein